MKFAELIAALIEAAGETPNPAFADLQGAYDADMGVYQGKIDALTNADAEKNTLISKLKEQNYDLLMQVGAPEGVEDPNDKTEDDDDDTDVDIEDLFKVGE